MTNITPTIQSHSLHDAASRDFDLSDLNTTVNCEPRVHDLLLAKKLGFRQGRNIRNLITRYQPKLERWGEVTCIEVKKRGQIAREYYLNERQALFICSRSDTHGAVELAIQMVEVFYLYRHGKLMVQQPPQSDHVLSVLRDYLPDAIASSTAMRSQLLALWNRVNEQMPMCSPLLTGAMMHLDRIDAALRTSTKALPQKK